MFITQPIFKRWVILSGLILDYQRVHRILPMEAIFECYINNILIPGKTEDEVLEATRNLIREIPAIKYPLKEWYYEYLPEIHNLKPVEQFLWLLRRMREILNMKSFGINKEVFEIYKRKLSEDYINLIHDSDLFD